MTKTPLPYWPAALGLEMAARYCGLSADTFKEVCPVKPIAFTSSSRGNRYLRARLDQWLDTVDPNQEGSRSPEHRSIEEYFVGAR